MTKEEFITKAREKYKVYDKDIMVELVVVCIKYNINLTFGKKYYVDMIVVDRLSDKYPNDKLYRVTDDNGKVAYYSEHKFLPLDVIRNNKLKELLE
jgi:hypothetical protein